MTPNTPRRGRYLVRNPVLLVWLAARDAVLSAFSFGLSRSRLSALGSLPATPARVLVAVGGHLGDALIATGVLAEISRRAPGAEIGVLCASWQRAVFDRHPLVRRIHVRDHWRLNRDAMSPFAKLSVSRSTKAKAVKEIRAAGYDVAIDLASHWPNASDVLRAAKVPVRVGYESGGGGPVYTRALPWTPRGHVFNEHLALIDAVLPSTDAATLSYGMAEADADAKARVDALLERAGTRRPFAILHVGAGSSEKEWPLAGWIAVAREIHAAGVAVVATGQGTHEGTRVAALKAQVPGLADLSNQLDWPAFHALIARAGLVVSVDTAAAHLAAGAGTRTLTLATGADAVERWRPIGDRVEVLVPDPASGEITLERVLVATARAVSAAREDQPLLRK